MLSLYGILDLEFEAEEDLCLTTCPKWTADTDQYFDTKANSHTPTFSSSGSHMHFSFDARKSCNGERQGY